LSIPVEFSRPLAAEAVPPGGMSLRLAASPAECVLLARRFELIGLTRLEGEVRVEPVGATGSIHLAGQLSADVVQQCVVTLEPVPARVEAEFDRLFSQDLPEEAPGEVEIDPEAEAPEPLVGHQLDLGEVLAEELSLALDPYPRSPDADRLLAELQGPQAREARMPFAPLDTLRRH